MFSIKYNEVDPFVTPQANVVMSKIYGSSFNGDVSMIATLRALLFERLSDEEEFFYQYFEKTQAPSANLSITDAIDYVFGPRSNNSLTIVNVLDKAVFDTIATRFSDKELASNEKIQLTEDTLYAEHMLDKAKLHIRAYINEENAICCILVHQMNAKFFHLIQSLIPRYFRKYFNDKPLQDDERDLLKTLTMHSGADYLVAISKVAARMNLRETFLRGMVKDFEKREMETLIRKAEERLVSLQNSIQDYMQRYSRAIQDHQDQMYRIEGMRAGLENKGDNSDLLDYLLRHPNIDIVRMEGSRIEIEVRTTLDLFDMDTWEHYVRKGEIFNNYNNLPEQFKEVNDRKLFLTHLFADDGLLRLKVRGYYSLNLNGNVDTEMRHTFKPICDDHFTNPHFLYHACLGSNRQQISQQLSNGEIIGAIECAVASCKSINMGEITQTVRPLFRDLFNYKKKVIQTSDGASLTPAEAITWLKEKLKK